MDARLRSLQHSIKLADADTIEVNRFENGSIRWILWFGFGLISYFLFQAWWHQDVMWDNIRLWLQPRRVWLESYNLNIERGWLLPSEKSFDEYQKEISEYFIHKYRWISGMNFVLLWLFTLYLAFFINLRPVRFNRKLGIAYTYNWAGFFITKTSA